MYLKFLVLIITWNWLIICLLNYCDKQNYILTSKLLSFNCISRLEWHGETYFYAKSPWDDEIITVSYCWFLSSWFRVLIIGCRNINSSSVLMSSGASEVYPESVVTVQCRTGYFLQEPYSGLTQVTLWCQEGGIYDKVTPVCARKFCYVLVGKSMRILKYWKMFC